MTGQIFNIFMVNVDDFGELPALDHLLKNPHVHRRDKLVILGCIGTYYLSDGRPPADRALRLTRLS